MTRANTVRTDAIQAAADRLRDAERTRVPCAPVRELLDDHSVATGYAVQSLLTEARLAGGARVSGRKIGLTAPAVQAQMGVDQPDFGFLFADMACAPDVPIAMSRLLQPRIEAEVAIILDGDLDTEDITAASVRGAVRSIVPALEIVDSRVAKWDITIVDTVADNASSGLYVLGDSPAPLGERDLAAVAMRLADNSGTVLSSGTGADCMGSPLEALAWLATRAREYGSPLRAGEVVLSGALGPMVPVVAGQTYRADFGDLGTVSARFTEA